jgi:hypothetical protein
LNHIASVVCTGAAIIEKEYSQKGGSRKKVNTLIHTLAQRRERESHRDRRIDANV